MIDLFEATSKLISKPNILGANSSVIIIFKEKLKLVIIVL